MCSTNQADLTVAEGVGFEPTMGSRPYWGSKPARSSALPTLLFREPNLWRMREGSNLRETLRPGYRLASGPLPTRARIRTQPAFRPAAEAMTSTSAGRPETGGW